LVRAIEQGHFRLFDVFEVSVYPNTLRVIAETIDGP
jgi:hypothetical protein